MGADGSITIYDADQVDQILRKHGIEDFDFPNVYERIFLGKRIYHVYSETERDLCPLRDERHSQCQTCLDEEIKLTVSRHDGLYISLLDLIEEAKMDTWEVWT